MRTPTYTTDDEPRMRLTIQISSPCAECSYQTLDIDPNTTFANLEVILRTHYPSLDGIPVLLFRRGSDRTQVGANDLETVAHSLSEDELLMVKDVRFDRLCSNECDEVMDTCTDLASTSSAPSKSISVDSSKKELTEQQRKPSSPVHKRLSRRKLWLANLRNKSGDKKEHDKTEAANEAPRQQNHNTGDDPPGARCVLPFRFKLNDKSGDEPDEFKSPQDKPENSGMEKRDSFPDYTYDEGGAFSFPEYQRHEDPKGDDDQFDKDLEQATRLSLMQSQSLHVPATIPSHGLHPTNHCNSLPLKANINDTNVDDPRSQESLCCGRTTSASIALELARRLLMELSETSLDSISTKDLNILLRNTGYDLVGGSDHGSVDHGPRNTPDFVGVAPCLETGPSQSGSVKDRAALVDAFQACLDFAAGFPRVAIVFTNSDQSVLCISDQPRWYLFHSQGKYQHQTKWIKFESFDALLETFATTEHIPDGVFDSNQFDAFAVIPRRFPECGPLGVASNVDFEWQDHDETLSSTTVSASSSPTFEAPDPEGDNPNPPGPALPLGAEFTDYQCAISLEIMADPVVTSDGTHYDRPNIEAFFDERRRQEEIRIAAEEAASRGEAAAPQPDAAPACCGGARPPIQLISPKTLLPVDPVLTPVILIEQQIVRLMETNALGLSEEDVEDWRQRRREKQERDQARRERERQQLERQEEMRRNALEAERLRNQEESQAPPPPLPQEPALRIRLDRDAEEERRGPNDLGVSVALADERHHIPVEYVCRLQESETPRCMVPFCASVLSSNQWCARCARLVCRECTTFGVTNVLMPNDEANDVSHVCFECAIQLVDAMASGCENLHQKRSLLLEDLETMLARLGTSAATKQAFVVQHQVRDEFNGKRREIQDTINQLQDESRSLKEQIREQERIAAESAADRGTDAAAAAAANDRLAELRQQCSALDDEYRASLQEQTPQNDEGALLLVVRRSDLAARLDTALTELAIAESSTIDTGSPDAPAEDPPTTTPRRRKKSWWSAVAGMLRSPSGDEEGAAQQHSEGSLAVEETNEVTGASSAQPSTEAALSPEEEANMLARATSDVAAIGQRLSSWPLPLGLEYPTPRMTRMMEVFRNTMELRAVEASRFASNATNEEYAVLSARRDELEDSIAETRRSLQDATSHAQQEQARREERLERHRQEEAARRAREEVLREEARRAREAAEALQRQHAAAEALTQRAFARARREGGARDWGGRGDLRMCQRCKAGPFENAACADLVAHNNRATDYKGNQVASVDNPNACIGCGWFTADWRDWPEWDGIYGPH